MQQPKRFQAPSLAEAYEQVRRDLGESSVILSTRTASAPGLFGQPGRQFVEVVARVPEPSAVAEPRPTLDQDAAAHDLVRAVAEASAAAPVASAASSAHAGFQAVAPAHDLSAPPSMRTSMRARDVDEPSPARIGAEPWSSQLDQMRGMLEQLLSERLDARIQGGPAGLRAMKDRLVAHGLPAHVAASVLGDVESGARAADERALAAAVERRLASMMPPVAQTMRRAVFLAGPAGAGKTTMAVRLALYLERREGLRVVVAGTDVNRAGAPQQLMAFGAATGLDVRLCYTPNELAAILADREVDAVIVDTPGHNGARRDRMAELSAFLQVARQRTVLLAVPATMKASDLADAATAFGAVGLDGLVVTRCDETAHFGAVVGAAIEAATGIAYTTQSDQVSDAPAGGDHMALAAAVVHGRWGASATALDASSGAPAAAPGATSSVGAATRRLARVG
ncbi:MAG: hypothetical protein WD058_03990 [Dehalococcoidia bacterium]